MSPYLEISLRAVGAFISMLAITRWIGKQQLGQVTVSDFVNAIAIGSIAASMATDHKENVLYYIIGLAIFGGLNFLINYSALISRPARKLLEGEPVVVIHNGKILEKNIAKQRYNMDNLTMQLREKNVFNIGDVEFAVLEPNGELSVLMKSDKLPLTASDINISTEYKGMSSELIIDGNIIEQNLEQNNLSRQWLYEELKKHGINRIEEVNYASLDSSGNLYIDRYGDKLNYVQDITDN